MAPLIARSAAAERVPPKVTPMPFRVQAELRSRETTSPGPADTGSIPRNRMTGGRNSPRSHSSLISWPEVWFQNSWGMTSPSTGRR